MWTTEKMRQQLLQRNNNRKSFKKRYIFGILLFCILPYPSLSFLFSRWWGHQSNSIIDALSSSKKVYLVQKDYEVSPLFLPSHKNEWLRDPFIPMSSSAARWYQVQQFDTKDSKIDIESSTREAFDLVNAFEGHYDNINQVEKEKEKILKEERRTNSPLTNPHEHLHCHIRRIKISERIMKCMHLSLDCLQKGKENFFIAATYYFNNNPNMVFRCRLYHLIPSTDEQKKDLNSTTYTDKNSHFIGEMRIFRFNPIMEHFLKTTNYDLSVLCNEEENLFSYMESLECGKKIRECSSDNDVTLDSTLFSLGEWLDGCEICWYKKINGNFSFDGISKVNRVIENSVTDWYHGTMKYGKCRIESQLGKTAKLPEKFLEERGKGSTKMKTKERSEEIQKQYSSHPLKTTSPFYITIYDDLSLWHGGILIEDRGEDDSNNLIYGHPEGVPYVMLRQ